MLLACVIFELGVSIDLVYLRHFKYQNTIKFSACRVGWSSLHRRVSPRIISSSALEEDLKWEP